MYIINEWIERYEVNEKGQPARPGDKLRVSPLEYIRSKVHGRSQGAGFARLQEVSGTRCYEVFGIFQKFLEIAGCNQGGKRGKLLNEKENPATIEDLSFILRTTEKKIAFALKILTASSVEWVKISPNEKNPEKNSFQEFQENQESKTQKDEEGGDTKTALKIAKTQINSVDKGHVPEIPGIPGKSGVFKNTTKLNTTKLNTTKQKSIAPEKQKYLDFVMLTDDEHKKLIEKIGQTETERYIERLNNYIGSKGKKYKSHYHTILNWSSKDNEERGSKIGSSSGQDEYFIR